MRTGTRRLSRVAEWLLGAMCLVAFAAACSGADNPGAPDEAPDLSEHRFSVGSADERVDYVARGGVLYTASGDVVLRRAEMPVGTFDRFISTALRMHSLRTESHGASNRAPMDARPQLTCDQIDDRYQDAQHATDDAYSNYIDTIRYESVFEFSSAQEACDDAVATEEMWHEAGHAAGCYD